MSSLKPLIFLATLAALWAVSPRTVVQVSPSTSSSETCIAEENSIKKIPKQQRVGESYQMEFEKTVDPAIGRVPRERLLEAHSYMESQNAIWKTESTSLIWKERGPQNVGGRTRAILVDPNDPTGKTVFAGGVGGGLWKTTDITLEKPNWIPINDGFANLAVTSIAADPTNPQVMYFSTGEGYFNADAIPGLGIWKSTNGGTTWTQLPSTNGVNGFYFIQRVLVTQTGTLLAATRPMGVLRSSNGGTTWTKVLGTGLGIVGAVTDIAYDLDQSTDGTIFATIAGSIHTSTNDGATFGSSLNIGVAANRIELAVAPSDFNTVYAVIERANGVEAIIKSTNRGVNWTSLTLPVDADPTIPANDFAKAQAWYNLCITVDPNNKNRVWVGGIDLFRTVDGGTTWSQMSHWWGGYAMPKVHSDQHYLLFHPGNSDKLYIGNDGGVFMTSDASQTRPEFEMKGTNYNVTQFYSVAIHPDSYSDQLMGGTQDNGTQYMREIEPGAAREYSGGDGGFCFIDQQDPQFQFTSYIYNNFYRSTNGGKSFTGISYNNGGRFINPSAYDDAAKKLYAANGPGNYLRWEDPQTGSTFTSVSLTPFGGLPTTLTISPNIPNRVYFGFGNGEIYRVDNAHATPTSVSIGTGLPTRYVSSIAIEEGNDNHIIVVFSNYGTVSVFETNDGGSNWVSIEGNLPDMPVRSVIFQPGYNTRLLIGTDLGVWKTDSINGSSTVWAVAGTGMPNVRVEMIKYRATDNMVVVATHGRGLFVTDFFSPEKAKIVVDRHVGYLGTTFRFQSYSRKGSTWEWDFGDGSPHQFIENPTHSYSIPGDYTVTLAINGGTSIDTLTNLVRVLPDLGTPFYLVNGGDFETNPNFFGAENLFGTTWERGNSAVAGKNGTASGSNAWVTGMADPTYYPKSEGVLYTPIFDMTATGIYNVEFDAKFKFESQKDGFRMEYSTDRGQTWANLGGVDASWYNYGNGAGNSVFLMGEPYFSGDESANFTHFLLDISSLAGNASVAFRLVFRSDANNGEVGVAFDNFQLQGPENGNPLPVAWSPLQGDWAAEGVQLNWTTYSERNNIGFEILRSTDGQQFQAIGFVEGMEYSSQTREYIHLDRSATADRYFYQLRQTDFDGAQRLSNIVELTRELPDLLAKTQVWPSPFHSELNLRLPEGLDGKVRVSLMDLTGNQLATSDLTDLSGQNLSLAAWTTHLSAGVYLLKVENGNQVWVKKIVKG